MSVNAGSATGYLDLDISNFLKNLDEANSQAGKVPKTMSQKVSSGFSTIGGAFTGAGTKLTNTITKPAMAAVGALTGITLVKGFQRLAGIDTARAKLSGLGHDGEAIEDIMVSALDSVRGTSYGMDEAATTAASAVAAGIKPGQDLTRYLSLAGDAAAIAGVSMSDMGGIINKVTTSGKAYNGELQQLSDRGIPIYQWLAEEAGIAADKVFDFASEGKVSSDMLLSAIENNIGGAAKTMGEQSFTAGIANVWAAVGRLGANFLDAGGKGGGFFSTMKPLISEFIGLIDKLAPVAEEWGRRFGEALGRMIERVREIIAWWQSLDDQTRSRFAKMAGYFVVFAVSIGPVLKAIGTLSTTIGGLITFFTKTRPWLTKLLPGGFKTLGGVVKAAAAPFAIIIAVVGLLIAAFVDLWKNNEEFRTKITQIWNDITNQISMFIQVMKDRLNDLNINFENITKVIKKVWQGFTEFMAPIFIAAFELILSTLKTIFSVIITVFDIFVSVFTGDWQSAWAGVKLLFVQVWDGLKDILSIALNMLKNLAQVFISWFGTTWTELWTKVSSFFKEKWNDLRTWFSNTIDNISSFFSEKWQAMGDWFNNLLESIATFFVETWTRIKDFFTRTSNDISTGFSEFIENILTWFSELPGRISAFFSEVWQNVSTWATDMWNKATETGTRFVNNIIEFFELLPYRLGYALGYAGATIYEWGIETWNRAREIGKNFIDNIIEFFSQLPGRIASFTLQTYNGIIIFVKDMVDKSLELGERFLNNIVTFFSELPGRIKTFLSNIWNNVIQWSVNMWNKAKETGTKFLNNFITFFEQLPGKVYGALSRVWNSITTWASNMWNKATEVGMRFLSAITTYFSQLPGRIGGFLSNTWQRVVTWATNMGNRARDMGITFVTNVSNYMSQLPGRVWAFLVQVVSRASVWVSDMGRKGWDAIKRLGDRAVAAASGMLRQMGRIGRDIVSGVWEGITGRIGWFTGKVNGFFTGIVDGAKSALGIKSPSKVMADQVGYEMARGAGVGFTDEFGHVTDKIQKDIYKNVNHLDTPSVKVDSELGDTLDESSDGLFNNVLGVFLTIEDKIAASIDRTASNLAMLVGNVNGIGYENVLSLATATASTNIRSNAIPSKYKSSANSKVDLTELNETLSGVRKAVEDLKDLEVTTYTNLDSKRIAKGTRDPLDNELGKKERDKNQAKGRK